MDESQITEHPHKILERPAIVRKAVQELGKVGLHIGLLECDGDTMFEIATEEAMHYTNIIHVSEEELKNLPVVKPFPVNYHGIPLKQTVLSENGKA